MAPLGNHARKAISVSLLLLLSLLFLPSLSKGQTFDNVGFMKNVPPELRRKFPVCDEFLKVKWIDPKRRIGRMRVDRHTNSKYDATLDLIVIMEQWTPRNFPRRFETYYIDQELACDKTFDAFVKGARLKFQLGDAALIIRKGKREDELFGTLFCSREWSRDLLPPLLDAEGAMISPSFFETLAWHTKNVCLIEPDGNEAAVVEEKEPFWDGMPDEASKQRYAAILNVAREHCDELAGKESRSVCDMGQVEFGTSIDIDGDGKEDYVSRFFVMDPARRRHRKAVCPHLGQLGVCLYSRRL